MSETILHLDKHVLLCFDAPADEELIHEYNTLQSTFCGRVFYDDDISWETIPQDAAIFFCGDVSKLSPKTASHAGSRLKFIKELSSNHHSSSTYQSISLGHVPINHHNAAIYFRNVLPPQTDYFTTIHSEHEFQRLTESDKPSPSLRKGIYLSKVHTSGAGETKFNLLRCSTNLSGPTLNFSSTDTSILALANTLATQHLSHPAELNHVLAQVYANTTVQSGPTTKERKARIKAHADKTKDMPRNGLIAFCTIYSSDVYSHQRSQRDAFDYQYKNTSVLTRLRFRLKEAVRAAETTLERDFSVPLYPNSILMIPLSTNRLYTHETVPPALDISNIPTRLGYVIRCSATAAVFRDGKTFIVREGGEEVEMGSPGGGDVGWLRERYFRENTTDEVVEYGDVGFSLNNGDYMRPVE